MDIYKYADLLSAGAYPLSCSEYDEGFFLGLPSEDLLFALDELMDKGFSTAFRGLVDAAVAMGAFVLRLDADANPVEGLPRFEW